MKTFNGNNFFMGVGGGIGNSYNAMYWGIYNFQKLIINCGSGLFNLSGTYTWVPNTSTALTYNNGGGTSSRAITLYSNSTGTEIQVIKGSPGSALTLLTTNNTLGIADSINTSALFNGQMNYFYCFNTALNANDRQIFEAISYGVPIPLSVFITGLTLSSTYNSITGNVTLFWTCGTATNVIFQATSSSNGAPAGPITIISGSTIPVTGSGPWNFTVTASSGANSVSASTTAYATLAVASKAANPGAVITTNGSRSVFTFKTSGTFTLATPGAASVLIVGGGGGSGWNNSGGGGAGGLVYFDLNVSPMILAAGTYTVTVGSGGLGSGGGTTATTNGGNSSFNGYIAYGGGYGGSNINSSNGYLPFAPNYGGCGGGCKTGTGTNGGISTQITYPQAYYCGGYPGGNIINSSSECGAGGGGAGGAGGNLTTASVPGVGGIGYQCNITGTAVYYAGGGGGGSYQSSAVTSGGLGGGGNGGKSGFTGATPGTANTGGGGGGDAGETGGQGGQAGGSGVVIILCNATA